MRSPDGKLFLNIIPVKWNCTTFHLWRFWKCLMPFILTKYEASQRTKEYSNIKFCNRQTSNKEETRIYINEIRYFNNKNIMMLYDYFSLLTLLYLLYSTYSTLLTLCFAWYPITIRIGIIQVVIGGIRQIVT